MLQECSAVRACLRERPSEALAFMRRARTKCVPFPLVVAATSRRAWTMVRMLPGAAYSLEYLPVGCGVFAPLAMPSAARHHSLRPPQELATVARGDSACPGEREACVCGRIRGPCERLYI